MAVCAILLAIACLFVDQSLRWKALPRPDWIYAGGPQGARAVLSTIAGSIITVAGTTFSITVAALSLASNQFGPRLLRNFIRDTGNQVVLGTYTATYLYCLLVLRSVRGLDDNTYVPHVSVTVSVVLAVFSVAVLIYFVHHVAESIQVSHLTERVAIELNDAVKRLFPEHSDRVPPDANLPDMTNAARVRCAVEGYVQYIDAEALFNIAAERDAAIYLLIRPGDYVFEGREVARAIHSSGQGIDGTILESLTVGRLRTTRQDCEFAFLQIAEIAVRALSPGINDPFTAVLCIDRITAAMVRLARRDMPGSVKRDSDGHVRVIAPPYDFDALTEAAFGHIAEAARGQAYVLSHLRSAMLTVLEQTTNEGFRSILSRRIECLAAADAKHPPNQ